MKLLNRSALMLQPLPAFIDWINTLPKELSELDAPLAVDALDDEGRVYLVAEFAAEGTPAQLLDSVLTEHWQNLLENELAVWDGLGSHWPEPLTQELLPQWFEIKPLALAFDADESPLMTALL